ncbi:DUF3558 domain-containing protein [Nocardia goodfellowii]
MRTKSTVVIGALLAVSLTACGGPGDSEVSTGPLRPPPRVAALGPFVGECGHVGDDEVLRTAGLGSVRYGFKNATGCNWQGASGTSVTFASYRGSPIDRERAWVASVGREPEAIEVGGHKGFAAFDPSGVCDLAVQLDDDFFEWSVLYGQFRSGNPCDPARALAELTVQRLG